MKALKEFNFENVPIVEIANEILLDAINMRVSDIHFDPTKEEIIIRFRIDGELSDYGIVPAKYKRNMISRLKMIASMNIMETRLPQDGAIKTKIGDRVLDLRVSSLPCNVGEKVVIRVLDYSKSMKGLEHLGFSEEAYKKIEKMISVPNGIILVTGATGSGKSTTVYSVLQRLNTEDVNIITVEDPIEMDIRGINQVQANADIGLTFATVLRSILRQDPDVIMIGEIRDDETARIAVRASITGHLVLSTLHTNNSLNTIERLTDMNVERYLLGSALTGVISQRLARRVCPTCRIKRETTDYEKGIFKAVLDKDVETMYEANHEGCKDCHGGYRERIAILEVLLLNEAIKNAITSGADKSELKRLVYSGDVVTLLQDGLLKVVQGETTFEEIIKIIDLENDLSNYDDDNLKTNMEIISMQHIERENQEHAANQRIDAEKMEATSTIEVKKKPSDIVKEQQNNEVQTHEEVPKESKVIDLNEKPVIEEVTPNGPVIEEVKPENLVTEVTQATTTEPVIETVNAVQTPVIETVNPEPVVETVNPN